ncbi:helix-turn-helix domain-containing protein [Salinarimonas soli]|uniref:Helix-turn-helix transcriptional regulator n=1 Tax=Salinarimonas soli TaxID=1638099 RepID=A0A5B2VBZ9_9HYPH|nr:helix-turn-helix transcriptional regulator [Salinarimonas soli]KAA2235942.1 helix-turn-helix transcriptional regulator [Salinarimonas soli]
MAQGKKAGTDNDQQVSPKSTTSADKAMGMRLREARLQAGLSQERLGEVLGVTFQQVQKYERGMNRVPSGRLKLIASTLDRPLGYFFGDDDDAEMTEARAGLMNRHAVTLLRYFNKLPEAHQLAVVATARALATFEGSSAAEAAE